jgi:hypothetical protein
MHPAIDRAAVPTGDPFDVARAQHLVNSRYAFRDWTLSSTTLDGFKAPGGHGVPCICQTSSGRHKHFHQSSRFNSFAVF